MVIEKGWHIIGNSLYRAFFDFTATIEQKDESSVLTISLGPGYEKYDQTMLFNDNESAMDYIERYQDFGKRIKKENHLN